jgi:hypothetical protein
MSNEALDEFVLRREDRTQHPSAQSREMASRLLMLYKLPAEKLLNEEEITPSKVPEPEPACCEDPNRLFAA